MPCVYCVCAGAGAHTCTSCTGGGGAGVSSGAQALLLVPLRQSGEPSTGSIVASRV